MGREKIGHLKPFVVYVRVVPCISDIPYIPPMFDNSFDFLVINNKHFSLAVLLKAHQPRVQ